MAEAPESFNAADHGAIVRDTLAQGLAGASQGAATAALQSWGPVAGFTSLLLEIIADAFDAHSDHGVRHMASVMVMLIVNRHWSSRMGERGGGSLLARRKAAEAAALNPALSFPTARVGDGEQAFVRVRLLQVLVDEPDNRIAAQLTSAAARIARMDWPHKWGDLLPTTLAQMSAPADGATSTAAAPALATDTRAYRAACLLHRVVKEKATMMTVDGRQGFRQMAEELFGQVAAAWAGHMEALLGGLAGADYSDADSLLPALDALLPHAALARMLFKSLNRIVVSGFTAMDAVEGIDTFWERVLQWTPHLLATQASLRTLGFDVGASGDVGIEIVGAAPGASGGDGAGDGVGAGSSVSAAGANHGRSHDFVSSLSRLVKKMCMCPVQARNEHPLPFRHYLGAFLQFFCDTVLIPCDAAAAAAAASPGAAATDAAAPAPLPSHAACIAALLFVADVLDDRAYQMSSGEGSVVPHASSIPAVSEAASVVSSFFSREQLNAWLDFSLRRCLPLTRADFEDWEDAPEDFVLAQEQIVKEDSVRLSGDALFMTLLDRDTEAVAHALLAMCGEVEAALFEGGLEHGSPDSDAAMTQLDALYLAMGLGSWALHKQLEFEPWFRTRLVPVLEWGATPTLPLTMRALLRRVVWLVSCWAAEIPDPLRPPLYGAVITCLNHPDAVVCLAACGTLQSLVCEWSFQSVAFVECLGPAVAGLYHGVAACAESESRLQFMDAAHSIVEKVGQDAVGRAAVEAVAGSIVEPLRALWGACDEDSMLLAPILKTLTQVVQVLAESRVPDGGTGADGAGAGSVGGARLSDLWPATLPLLGIATDVGHPAHVFACEAALALWHVLMDAAEEYTADFHALVPRLVALIAKGLFYVEPILTLIDDYVLLGGRVFMESYASDVAGVFRQAFGAVKARVAQHMCRVIDTLFTQFPAEAPPTMTGVLNDMLMSASAHDDESRVTASYLMLLARVLVQTPDFFAPFIGDCVTATSGGAAAAGADAGASAGAGAGAGGGGDAAMTGLLQIGDMWVDRYDDASASSPTTRPLYAMALTMVLAYAGHVAPRETVESALHTLVTAIGDVASLEGTAAGLLPDDIADGVGGPGASRRRAVLLSDVAVSADLRGFVTTHLQTFRANIGGEQFAALMASMGPGVAETLALP